MVAGRLAGLALALAGALALLPATARADDGNDDRIARLERLLAEQARQIESLRSELRARGAPHAAPAPAPAPAPARPAAVPARRPPLVRAPAPLPPPQARPTSITRAPANTRLPMGWTTPAAAPAPRLERASAGAPGHVLSLGSGGRDVRWGGYLTLEYVANSTKNSFFDLHRLILQLDADITESMGLTAELEFEHGGIGGGRTGDVEVEHLAVDWRVCDALRFVIGAPLIPFGRFNEHHDDPLNDFTKRPLTGRYLVPTGFGQPGVGLGGAVPVGSGTLSYDVLLTTGFSDGFTESGGVRGARQAWQGDNNESKQVWGRAAFATSCGLFDRMEIGLSGTWGRYDDESRNDLVGYGVDWLFRKGPLELQGEYIAYDIDRDPLDAATAVRGQSGLWAEAAWHFFPSAWRATRSPLVTATSLFTLGVRYQHIDLDDRRVGAAFNDDLDTIGVAFNYRLTERTVFRVDYTWLDAEAADDQTELTLSFSSYF